MSILHKDLPISICALSNNPEGEKTQAKLLSIDAAQIIADTGELSPLPTGTLVRVEFRLDRYNFSFDSLVARTESPHKLYLAKPKEIHRSRLRDAPRLPMDLEIFYTIWTESGRFQAKILDLSEQGIRIAGPKSLRKGLLISLNFYLKESKIRVICQGLVAWSHPREDNEYLFEAGIEFTTISNETKKKIAKHIEMAGSTGGIGEAAGSAPSR